MSPEMLDKGRAKHPDWNWVLAGIEDFHPAEPFDAVISCAALQWLHGHDRLLPRLWELVRDGGALAVQMPANQDSPLHRAVFQTAESEAWRPLTGHSRATLNFQPPTEYFSILSPLAKRLDIWETIYYHEMRSLDDLLEWARTTVMRPFFGKIPEVTRQNDFVADVKRACAEAYPATNRGTILYVQKRLFFVAYKSR
jgi:trans-aconitate 2-methyltransferase